MRRRSRPTKSRTSRSCAPRSAPPRSRSRRSTSASTPTSAFSSAARAAGLIGAGATFDPYADDENFLLGAFIFEDVGVTAYKGASPLITNKTYPRSRRRHPGGRGLSCRIVRTTLYAKGVATPSLRTSADAISDARDSLDGTTDLDQGISPVTINGGAASNIAPLDANGLAYQPDDRPGAQHRLSEQGGGHDGRVLPGRRQRHDQDQRRQLIAERKEISHDRQR